MQKKTYDEEKRDAFGRMFKPDAALRDAIRGMHPASNVVMKNSKKAPPVEYAIVRRSVPRLQSVFNAAPTVPETENNNSAPAEISKRTYKPDDANTDYTTLINDAVKNGNYAKAAEYEKLRNLKISDMGLPYSVTDNFNYIDKNGYGGAADRLYNQIESYNQNGFNYDYKSDPRYQQILSQQKKEAKTQFENGLAELSARFGGDVPANLIGGLLKTSQDTIDAADNYIPQLWQMAQDMWINEGNQLYNQYNLASMRAADDYNKWAADRGFYTQGFENEYGRGLNERNYNRNVLESDRNYNEDVRRYNQDFGEDVRRYDKNYNEDVRRYDKDFGEDVRRYNQDFGEDVRRYNQNYNRAVYESDRDFGENAWRYNNEHWIKGGIERPTIPTVTTPAPVTTTPTTTTPQGFNLTNKEAGALVAAVAEKEGMTPLQAEEFANSVVSKSEATENPSVLMLENKEDSSQTDEQVFAKNVAQAINETPAEAAPEASYFSDLPPHWTSFFSKERPKISKTSQYAQDLIAQKLQKETQPESLPIEETAVNYYNNIPDISLTKEQTNAVSNALTSIMEKAINAGLTKEEAYDVAVNSVASASPASSTKKSTPASTQPKSTSSNTQKKSTDKTNETSGKVSIDADGNIIFKKK